MTSSLKTPHHHPTPWRELCAPAFFLFGIKNQGVVVNSGIAFPIGGRYIGPFPAFRDSSVGRAVGC